MTQSQEHTVLLVDDDPDIRQALKMHFALGEFQVVAEAADGLEAIKLAALHKPAFVILDYYMPRLNGHKAAKLLREVSPQSRIVAFSAVLSESPRWADAYLDKTGLSRAVEILRNLDHG